MTRRIFLCIVLAAGMVLASLAQAQARGRYPGSRHGAMGQVQPGRSQDPRDMIENLRIVGMTKELNLTDQQLAKFLPEVREDQAARREYFQNRSALVGDIENLLNRGASDKELQTKLSEMDRLENDFRAKQRDNQKALMRQLSVAQQARFVVFQDHFEHEIRDLIRGIRQGGPQPGMGPPPAPGSKAS
jgi:hypothetical protein